MKKFYSVILAFALLATVAAQTAKADYRNVTLHTTGSYLFKYSFGQVMAAISSNGGRPAGGWMPIPFAVSNPSIIGSKDFTQIPINTMTSPMSLQSGQYLSFDLEVSTNDSTVNGSGYNKSAAVAIELVGMDGTVLATPFSFSSVSGALWSANGQQIQTYKVPSSLVGVTAYLCMVVTPNTSLAPIYDLQSSTSAATLAYTAASSSLSKQASPVVASSVVLNNAPNPVSSYTTINIQNVSGAVSLKVYDILGNVVADLTSALTSSNTQQVPFNAASLNSGTYFYRLISDAGVLQRQMIVRK